MIKIENKPRIEDFDSIDKYLDALLYEARRRWKEEKEQKKTPPEKEERSGEVFLGSDRT